MRSDDFDKSFYITVLTNANVIQVEDEQTNGGCMTLNGDWTYANSYILPMHSNPHNPEDEYQEYPVEPSNGTLTVYQVSKILGETYVKNPFDEIDTVHDTVTSDNSFVLYRDNNDYGYQGSMVAVKISLSSKQSPSTDGVTVIKIKTAVIDGITSSSPDYGTVDTNWGYQDLWIRFSVDQSTASIEIDSNNMTFEPDGTINNSYTPGVTVTSTVDWQLDTSD